MLRAFVAVVALCLLASGCSATVAGKPVAGQVAPAPSAPAKKAERPKDRSQVAVLSALRRIDACALVDLKLAKRVSAESSVQKAPLGPHACAAVEKRFGGDIMRVAVGEVQEHIARFRAKPIELAGAKAYEMRTLGEMEQCRVFIPVSFDLSVDLDYEDEAGAGLDASCGVLHSWGEYVVKKLRRPGSIKLAPNKRPFAAWDGCTMLVEILPDSKKYKYRPNGTYDPFSGCWALGENKSVKLEVQYGSKDDIRSGTRRTIGGKKVTVRSLVDDCVAEWVQGPSRVAQDGSESLLMELSAPCGQINGLVSKVIKKAKGKPSSAGKPQSRLLYKPTENDTAAPGACAHFANGAGPHCEPYHPVQAPRGYDAMVEADTKTRDATCAVFYPAIQKHFGENFEAVTYGAFCYFVDETHTIDIGASVLPELPGHIPNQYSDEPGASVDRRQIELGGRPALVFFDSRRNQYDIYVSHVNDLDAPGGLNLFVQVSPPRGIDTDENPTVSPELVEKAQRAMADVVERSLN
jgi:hypothetical protein